jgi:hypothetical protein
MLGPDELLDKVMEFAKKQEFQGRFKQVKINCGNILSA